MKRLMEAANGSVLWGLDEENIHGHRRMLPHGNPTIFRSPHWLVALLIVALIPFAGYAADDPQTETYTTQIIWCRVANLPDLRAKQETLESVESILAKPVNFTFKNIHVQNILDSISALRAINFLVDSQVVLPPERHDSSNASSLDGEFVTGGLVEILNANEIPLSTALDKMLKPLGLGYKVQPRFVWISTPVRLESETFSEFGPELLENKIMFRDSGRLYFADDIAIHLGARSGDVNSPPNFINEWIDVDGFELVAQPNIISALNEPLQVAVVTEIPVPYLEIIDEQASEIRVRKAIMFYEAGHTIQMVLKKKNGQLIMDFEARHGDSHMHADLPSGAYYLGKPEIESAKVALSDQPIPLDTWFALITNMDDEGTDIFLITVNPMASREVAMDGALFDVAGSIDQSVVNTGRTVGSIWKRSGVAYLVPLDKTQPKSVEEQIASLGSWHYQALLSAPKATVKTDVERLTDPNASSSTESVLKLIVGEPLALSGGTEGAGGRGGGGAGPVQGNTDKGFSNIQAILPELLSKSERPGRRGVFDTNELFDGTQKGSALLLDSISKPDPRTDGDTTPITRHGDYAIGLRINSVGNDAIYETDFALQFRLSDDVVTNDEDDVYFQTDFDTNFERDQPYALVMPLNKDRYLVYLVTFSQAD